MAVACTKVEGEMVVAKDPKINKTRNNPCTHQASSTKQGTWKMLMKYILCFMARIDIMAHDANKGKSSIGWLFEQTPEGVVKRIMRTSVE